MSSLKKQLTLFTFILLVCIAFFAMVSPGQLPVTLILLPFLLLFLLFYIGVTLIVHNFFRLSRKSEQIIALSLSIMPVLLLVIQSITQLTFRDVVLTLGIIVILIWYTTTVSPAG